MIDNYCFIWCILAYLFPVNENKNRTSNYSMHILKLSLDRLGISQWKSNIYESLRERIA